MLWILCPLHLAITGIFWNQFNGVNITLYLALFSTNRRSFARGGGWGGKGRPPPEESLSASLLSSAARPGGAASKWLGMPLSWQAGLGTEILEERGHKSCKHKVELYIPFRHAHTYRKCLWQFQYTANIKEMTWNQCMHDMKLNFK